jgi:hypothetical protein
MMRHSFSSIAGMSCVKLAVVGIGLPPQCHRGRTLRRESGGNGAGAASPECWFVQPGFMGTRTDSRFLSRRHDGARHFSKGI